MNRLAIAMLMLVAAVSADAQSSSLYVARPELRESVAEVYGRDGRVSRLSPAIAETSLVAVPMPAPRRFSEQDLVTVIIREETQSQWDAGLATEKDVNWDAELAAFPDLQS